MRSVKEMASGVGSIIGNGKTTKILDPVWAGDMNITFQAHNQNSLVPKPLRISDLLTNNHSWNDEVLNFWFDHHTAKLIKTMHIPSFNKEDEFVWINSRNGDYLQKSGYWFDMQKEEVEPKTIPFWKKFWSLKF